MIAVPIVSKSVDGALKDVKLAEDLGADMVEFRLDYMSALTDDSLRKLMSAANVVKIVTARRKIDGGYFRGNEKERLMLLEKACSLGADYVDIEIDVDFSVFENAGAKIICSYHNFNQTPCVGDLLMILKSCAAKQASVVKIVTMAAKYSDNATILEFLERSGDVLSKDVKIVSFCMGEKGKLSRVLCTRFGSFLTFASLKKGRESALGQVDVSLMKEIDEVMI